MGRDGLPGRSSSNHLGSSVYVRLRMSIRRPSAVVIDESVEMMREVME